MQPRPITNLMLTVLQYGHEKFGIQQQRLQTSQPSPVTSFPLPHTRLSNELARTATQRLAAWAVLAAQVTQAKAKVSKVYG